ncbi:hypothetical protein [Labilibaculum euxinus]
MLYLLIKNICNRKLARRQAEIEELLENYHEIVLKSNEKVRQYYEEKKRGQQELITSLENENRRYFKIVDEIIYISKSFSEKYLQILDLGIAYFNAKMQEQLTQLQIGVIESAKEVTKEEIKTINELLSLYKKQSDLDQRIDYLCNIKLEFNDQYITTIDEFENYLKEKKFMQGDKSDLILLSERESFKRVSIRLVNERKLRESIKRTEQKGVLLEAQKSKLYREKGKKIKEIVKQKHKLKELMQSYKYQGNKYSEIYYSIDSRYILRELYSEIDSFNNIKREINREKRLLSTKIREIINRQREISTDSKVNSEEIRLIKLEVNELFKMKSYCHESNDYSEFESIKRDICLKKEELSILKDAESKLNSSREYYNGEFQIISGMQEKLNGKLAETQSNLNELEQQKKILTDLLYNSIKPFNPGSISYRFNNLNKEITDIGFYYLPGLPAIKRNK